MTKIIILGNSSSGKSSLASKIAELYQLSHLDLDTIAWESSSPPQRRIFSQSCQDIVTFMEDKTHWVMEGCYGDLISFVCGYADRLIFLNPSMETCINNCRQRPWEIHKYESLEAQNANLEMLIQWIQEYATRSDEFSLWAHRQIFSNFQGKKVEYNSNWIEDEVISWLGL